MSIDLNGEDGAIVVDLDQPVPSTFVERFDVVTNYGTLEHVNNQFQAWKNVHHMCRIGGVMIHSLTPPGHWPRHGRYYYSQDFVIGLAKSCEYDIVNLTQRNCYAEHTCGLDKDLILVAYLKSDDKFVPKEQFDILPLTDTRDVSHTGNYATRTPDKSGALAALLGIYKTRDDLQVAYPEARHGDYIRLLEWANHVIENRIDAYSQLQCYASRYRDIHAAKLGGSRKK